FRAVPFAAGRRVAGAPRLRAGPRARTLGPARRLERRSAARVRVRARADGRFGPGNAASRDGARPRAGPCGAIRLRLGTSKECWCEQYPLRSARAFAMAGI